MHTQKNDQIMFAFYRWDAKIKSCKEQDLFDICRQSQSLIRQLLNLVFENCVLYRVPEGERPRGLDFGSYISEMFLAIGISAWSYSNYLVRIMVSSSSQWGDTN